MISEPGKAKQDRILVVDDDPLVLASLKAVLVGEGYTAQTASSGEEALALLARDTQDLMIVDIRMKQVNGIEVLKHVKARWPETEVILLTAYQTVDSAIEAIRYGAYDYLLKPCNPEHLKIVIRRGLEKKQADLERRSTTAYLQTLVSSLPLGLAVFDAHGILQMLNPLADRLLGGIGAKPGQPLGAFLEHCPREIKDTLKSLLPRSQDEFPGNQQREAHSNGLRIRSVVCPLGTLLLLEAQTEP